VAARAAVSDVLGTSLERNRRTELQVLPWGRDANPQSVISNPQPAIRNPQSVIRNP